MNGSASSLNMGREMGVRTAHRNSGRGAGLLWLASLGLMTSCTEPSPPPTPTPVPATPTANIAPVLITPLPVPVTPVPEKPPTLPPCGPLGLICPSDYTCTPEGTCLKEDPIGDLVFVPAGKAGMGCNPDQRLPCSPDERPWHQVTLSAFAIERTEVTVKAYRRCVDAGKCSVPRSPEKAKRCTWPGLVAGKALEPLRDGRGPGGDPNGGDLNGGDPQGGGPGDRGPGGGGPGDRGPGGGGPGDRGPGGGGPGDRGPGDRGPGDRGPGAGGGPGGGGPGDRGPAGGGPGDRGPGGGPRGGNRADGERGPSGRSGRPGRVSPEDMPLNCVTYDQAIDYCLFAGRELPTEAQWERAARGLDGRRQPWGNEPLTCERANVFLPPRFCVGDPQPAGQFPAGTGPYGAVDQIGNLLEWTRDWYDAKYYYDSPDVDPPGPSQSGNRTLRGSSFSDAIRGGQYVSARYFREPDTSSAVIGFRCIKPGG